LNWNKGLGLRKVKTNGMMTPFKDGSESLKLPYDRRFGKIITFGILV